MKKAHCIFNFLVSLSVFCLLVFSLSIKASWGEAVRITSEDELSSGATVSDVVPIIDVSDDTDNAAGTLKKITTVNLIASGVTGTKTSGYLLKMNDDGEVEASSTLDISSIDMGEGTMEVPNDQNTDAALTETGQIHYHDNEDRFSFFSGASGEVTGEVTRSMLDHIAVAFNPSTQYDTDHQVFLLTLGDDYPNGVIFTEWKVSCNGDPATELELVLAYADDFITLGSGTTIDVLDTTNGLSSEDTNASINSGNAVANGKVLYLELGNDLGDDANCVQLIFEAWFYAEED